MLYVSTHAPVKESNRARGIAAQAFLACLILAGCAREQSTGEAPSSSANTPRIKAPAAIDPAILAERRFNEAPMLAERVAAGKLPPVAERLPENPFVAVPVDEIGTYGGTIRRALNTDIIDFTAIKKSMGEALTAPRKPLHDALLHNLAESHEYFDEGRTAIVRLRKGIKWSDGAPFTVDDVLFWYEDMALDKGGRNNPIFPARWLIDGKPVKMEKVDDHVLKFSANRPLGRLLRALSHEDIAVPRHIFSHYHPRYNPEANYEDFRDRTTQAQLAYQPGVPDTSPWIPMVWERSQRAVFERNPYYWKIDTAGNQLPYTDRLEFTIIPSMELILLKFTNGELDLFGRNLLPNMYPALKSQESRKPYTVRLTTVHPSLAFYFNWDVARPALREAFRDRQVRIALSHALNREEIGRLAFNDLLEPSGYSYGRSSPYYSEEAAMLYAQYDPEKARRVLDEAGYRSPGAGRYRTLRDGSVFELTIDVFAKSVVEDMAQLAKEHWEAVGVRVNLNIALQEILLPRRLNGTFEVHVTGSPYDPLSDSDMCAIVGPNLPLWHRNASTDGPEWLHEVTRSLYHAQTTIDAEEFDRHMIRMRDIQSEEIPFIVIGSLPGIWASHDRLGNVPPLIDNGDAFRGWEGPVFHEQIFIRD